MVIQRIQSVYLFIAAVLMAIFCFVVPVATIPDVTTLYVKDITVMLIINLIIAILLFTTIFLFKNLRLQMRMTLLSLLLIVVDIATGAFILTSKLPEDSNIMWLGFTLITVFAAIFTIAGYRGMKSDKRKLESYDRLR